MELVHLVKCLSIYLAAGATFALVLALIMVAPSQGMKCIVSTEFPEEWYGGWENCYTSNRPNFTDFRRYSSNVTLAALEQYEYDDNSHTQCRYKGIGLLTPEGTLKKNQAQIYYKKSELTKDVLDKVTKVWDQCWDDAVKIGKKKGFNQCKTLGLFDHCNKGRTHGRNGYNVNNNQRHSHSLFDRMFSSLALHFTLPKTHNDLLSLSTSKLYSSTLLSGLQGRYADQTVVGKLSYFVSSFHSELSAYAS